MSAESKPTVDPGLAEDLESLAEETDGLTGTGTITEVQPDGRGDILVKVVVPGGATEKYVFDEPAADSTTFNFVRFADEYGDGIRNLPALQGAEVDMEWRVGWEVVVPDEPTPLPERAMDAIRISEEPFYVTFGLLPIVFLFMPFILIIMLAEGRGRTEGWDAGYFEANVAMWIWLIIIAAALTVFGVPSP